MTEANIAYSTETKELLIIALILALYKVDNIKCISFELEGHGREQISDGINVNRTVGWFTTMFPVNFFIEASDLNSVIKEVKEQIRAIPKNGLDYGILKYINKSIVDRSKRLIRFNYLDDFDNILNGGLLTPANEDTGLDCDKYNFTTSLIDVNVLVKNKKLHVSMTYCKNDFDDDNIKNLIDSYMNNVKEIVTHCCNKVTREFTPSDFDGVEISMEDLDNLLG